jgi:uncharacterized protein (DUF305 family)
MRLAATIVLFACASMRAHGQTMSMPMTMPEVKIPAGANYTEADVRFMQGMMHHHAQAITMAAMAPTHGASARLALLAKKIDLSQRDEITMMKTWLESRHQAVPDLNGPHAMMMMMPGMLTPDQMKALDAAKDTAFDRLFLTGMIQHHQGAIKMVADLIKAGGAQASEMFGYTSGIDNDQRAEISIMQQMLGSSPPPKSSPQ